MTFQLAIGNKDNSFATNKWTTSSGRSGTDSLTGNEYLPTGENLALDTQYDSNGWGTSNYMDETQLHVLQRLVDTASSDPPDPNGRMFQGRQVYELANGTPTDSCFDAAVNNNLVDNPSRRFAILGSVWNVGSSGSPGNQYGDDVLGWPKLCVDWYQQMLPASAFPCQATLSQAMVIVDTQNGNQQFATHTITVTLTKTSVTVSKDGLSRTLIYPK